MLLMSTTEGPMVPARTLRSAFSPEDLSTSSNFGSVMRGSCEEEIGAVRSEGYTPSALKSRRWNTAAPPAAHCTVVAPAGWQQSAAIVGLFDDLKVLPRLDLAVRVEPVNKLQLLLLVFLDRHVLRVLVEVRLLVRLDDFQAIRLGERILGGPEIAQRLDR